MLGSLLSTQRELTILNRPRQKATFSGFSLNFFLKEMCILVKSMKEQKKHNGSDTFIGEGDPGLHRSTTNESK